MFGPSHPHGIQDACAIYLYRRRGPRTYTQSNRKTPARNMHHRQIGTMNVKTKYGARRARSI